MFMGVAETVYVDQNNTMAVNGQVEVEDLQKDISKQMELEKQENMMVPANFDDTLPTEKNPLMGTQKFSEARVNQKDNMLKYQISDDKDENELLDVVMGKATINQYALKDGDLIETDNLNKTEVIKSNIPEGCL